MTIEEQIKELENNIKKSFKKLDKLKADNKEILEKNKLKLAFKDRFSHITVSISSKTVYKAGANFSSTKELKQFIKDL